MDGNDLLRLGYRPGHIVGLALKAAKKAQAAGVSEEDVKSSLLNVLNMPESYADDPVFGQVAGQLIAQKPKQSSASQNYELNTSAPYRVWGSSQIEPGALDQLKRAVRLPVAVRGALMPDAHQGYGLPIGGVLATWNSVIPYAVGVDIACRMRLTVFDAAPYVLEQKRDKFRKILEEKTRFGTGSAWAEPRNHEVMDDPAWSELSVVRRFKDIAWQQL
jgi:tRNA-splicing ligase RtcB